MATLTQPIKWHGGKHYLAKRIIAEFPPHIHYVEPYFGGGSVLLQKPVEWIEGHSEVVNDVNGWLQNFWDCLKDRCSFEIMRRTLAVTPFSEVEFARALDEARNDYVGMFDVATAISFFIRYRQSRQGLGKDFATLTRNRTRRRMNEQVSSWWSAIEGLPEVHERLKRVVILNDDALKVIKQQDGPNVLFYLDPPYLHETRVTKSDYEFEMTETQHFDLLKTLGHIKGKFILSGYRSAMYDRDAERFGWRRVDIEIDNKASSKNKKDVKTECLWMNY